MKTKVTTTSLLLCLVVLDFGCATTGKFSQLELDMTKAQIVRVIGQPDAVRGSLRNRYGQTVEVWEYQEYKTADDAFIGNLTTYWLYVYDGKLAQWGQAGDWSRAADAIYEMRFR